jgi:ribosomal protein L40E
VFLILIIINLSELIIIWITGTIDPGIMKRNEDCFGCHELPIKLVHKGAFKTTKICLTCNVVRPFRSTHCSDCDNCTLRFDHHCPWIGGCVGKRNYIYFFIFLILLNIKNIIILVFSIIQIFMTYINVEDKEKKINSWVAKKLISLIPSIFVIIFIVITMIFTTGLIIYHINLIITNKTTKEEIKKLLPIKIGNPYDRGASYNCHDFWNRHKSMKNNYTVKDLRTKVKVEQNIINVPSKKFEAKLAAYSLKEQKLRNKAINNSISSSNNSLNSEESKNEKSSKNLGSSNNDEKNDCYSDNSSYSNNSIKENSNRVKNNNKINKSIRNNSKTDNNRYSKKNSNIINNKRNSRKRSSYTEDRKKNEENSFSEEDISDENDNSNRKICNTSIKNNNNLDNNNHINNLNDNSNDNKSKIKKMLNEKNLNPINNHSYKIAQQRLEELSSEITIHEEVSQIRSSISIPKENSFNTSLSQS